MTRDPRLYFPSEGRHTQDFYTLKKPSTLAGFEPVNLGSSGEYDNHETNRVAICDFYLWELKKTNVCKKPLQVR